MANIKELAKLPEHLSSGHRLCAGCGASIIVRQVLMGTKDYVVAGASTGCLEVATTIYPYTAWKMPFIHCAFENVAATISGVETAYKALKKKGKINKEIKFIAFGGDGGCYSDDTEIFTEDGFKNIQDIKVGEKIWSVNPETNELELQENEKLHKYPYKGMMIRGKSRFIDFLITPNHNVPMWYKGRWEFIKGIDLIKRYKTSFLRKFYWYGNGIKISEIEVPKIPRHRFQKEFSKFEIKKWLRFLGWYISEGTLYKSKSGYLIRIYQSNKDKKEKIYNLLQELGLSPFKCNRSVDFQSKQIYEYLEKECGKGFKNKKIPKWALSLDRDYLRQIFSSLMEGDGSVTKQENRSSHHLRYITASDTLMNDMVELILKLGRNCNVSKRKKEGVYIIGIDNEYLKHKLYSRRRLYGDKQQVLLENYKGFVYCPQLKKNHTVIIKRNGKISLSGNSYDIGLQSLSGALERGHKFVYVCLPPDTELILEDGTIAEIGKIVEETIKLHSKKGKAKVISDNSEYNTPAYKILDETEKVEIFPLVEKSLLSWNGIEFVPMKAISAQRKPSPKHLIKITSSSGLTLNLTAEHPVLIDGPDGPEWKEAGLLKVGDEVYSARKINIFNKNNFYFIDLISKDRNVYVTLPEDIKVHINNRLVYRFGNIKKAAQSIGFKYWQFKETHRNVNLYDLKEMYQRLPELNWNILRNKVDEFIVRGGNAIKVHNKQLDESILYLLGLISSEGYIRKQNYGITFVNKETALIDAFENAYLKISDRRKINKVQDKNGVWYLTISDPIIYNLAKIFDIKDNPKELMRLSEPLIIAFLRGYFDGDGHCSIVRTNDSHSAIIILSTVKKLLADRLRLLLQRIGIAGFQDNREYRFDIHISSTKDITKFIDLIGSNSPAKQKAMKEAKDLLKHRKTRDKYFNLAPKVCGKLIKELCRKYDIPLTIIDRKRNICTLAVAKRRASKQKIREYLNKMGDVVLRDPLIYKINNLLVDDFYLDPIRKLEKIETEFKYVYDLTIEPSHVFVPGGKFVISNCYNNEAYMNCLSTSSMIMTEKGLKKITEVKTGDKVYAFDQKAYQLVLKECTGVFDNGVKDVYELSTLHHSIKTTSNHPFLVLKRNGKGKYGFVWKKLEDVRIGDQVVTLKGLNGFSKSAVFDFKKVKKGDYKVNKLNDITMPRTSTPDLMRYIGLYIGDGWIREKKGEVGFALPEGKTGRKELVKIHAEIFGSKINDSSDKDYIYIHSVNLANFIKSLNIDIGAKNKTIPSWTFTLPIEQKEALLEGLMLSDGYKCGNSWRYVSVSEDLLKSLRLFLQTMGKRVGKIHWQVKTKGTPCGKRKLLKDSRYGYICFSNRRIWNIKKYYYQYRNQNFLIGNEYFELEKVQSIKLMGKEPTLDLRVEGEHNFIADGIAVHNTGIQRSSATPKGASTTTAPPGKVTYGKEQPRKDLTSIVAAHRIPYVAQASPSHWNDLITKAGKAFNADGPAFLNVISVCPRGWRSEEDKAIEISKLAVETDFWPLIEVENGIWRFTYKPKERKGIIEFLKTQGRFKHLFTEENKHIIDEIQKEIDENWARLENLCNATCKVA